MKYVQGDHSEPDCQMNLYLSRGNIDMAGKVELKEDLARRTIVRFGPERTSISISFEHKASAVQSDNQ